MMARLIVCILALASLQGCGVLASFAGLPLAYQIPIATGAAAAAGGAALAYHDCKQDGALPECLDPFTPAK